MKASTIVLSSELDSTTEQTATIAAMLTTMRDMTMVFDILSIDAVCWSGHWEWNDARYLRRDIEIDECDLTSRKIARLLRDEGLLTEHSRGRIVVDFSDESTIEIQNKGTRQPLFALRESYPLSASL